VKIAFIGLGHMGGPMARNLLKAGHSLKVFDLLRANVDALTGAGARAADSAALAAADAEMVITMLPSAPQVRAVYLGEGGVIEHIPKGVPLVDSSTIDPHTAREVAAVAERQGNPMADAPVSGGTPGAEAGTLTFMVGAAKCLFERIEPVLLAMGKSIVHCGPAGNGQAAKICNNMLLGISMIGVAESMSLGVSLGLDPKLLAGVINSSSGRCWSCDTYNPYPGVLDHVPAARGYSGGFAADLMLKDLGLATDAAARTKQALVLGAAAQRLYQSWSDRGFGSQDFSAIINLFKTA
jgi:3-hydroxyisobutyrate dehydrogenase